MAVQDLVSVDLQYKQQCSNGPSQASMDTDHNDTSLQYNKVGRPKMNKKQFVR